MAHNVTVTGVSGFIGRYLAAYLVKTGCTVVGIDIVAPDEDISGVKYIQCDILDYEKLQSIVKEEQPTHLFHLAAKPKMDAASWKDFPEIIDGTNNVARAFMESVYAKRFVNISTQLVISPKDHEFEMRQYDPYTHYGAAKALAEQNLDGEQWPFEILHLRPTNIWGPHHPSYNTSVLKYIAKRVYMQPRSADRVKRTYGYVENSARQIAELGFLPQVPDRSIYYIGDGPMKTGEYLDALSLKLTNKPIIRVPDTPLWLLAQIGSFAKAFGVSFPFDKGRYFRMTTDYIVPVDLAQTTMAGNAVAFDKGISETVDNYLKSNAKN